MGEVVSFGAMKKLKRDLEGSIDLIEINDHQTAILRRMVLMAQIDRKQAIKFLRDTLEALEQPIGVCGNE